MSTVVDELIVLIGVEGGEKASQTLVGLKGQLGAAIGVAKMFINKLEAMSRAYYDFTRAVTSSYEQTGLIAKQSGVSAEALQEMRYGVERLGGSAKSLDGDLQGLYASMTSPVPGQFNETLARMGIAALDSSGKVRSMEAVLGDVSDRFRQGGELYSLQMGKMLGISPDTIRLLQNGREELSKIRQRSRDLGLIIPQKQIDQSQAFERSMRDIETRIKRIKEEFVIRYSPAIQKAAEGMLKFVNANRSFLDQRIANVIEQSGIAIDDFMNKLKNSAFAKFLSDLNFSGTAIDRFVMRLRQFASFSFDFHVMKPLSALLTVLTAVYLVWEDLITAFEGAEDSFSGRMFEGLNTALLDLKDTLNNFTMFVLEKIDLILNKFTGLSLPLQTIKAYKSIMDDFMEDFKWNRPQVPERMFVPKYIITPPKSQTPQANGGSPASISVVQNIHGTANAHQTANMAIGALSSVSGMTPGSFSPAMG